MNFEFEFYALQKVVIFWLHATLLQVEQQLTTLTTFN